MKQIKSTKKDVFFIFTLIFLLFSIIGWMFLKKFPEYHLFRISGYDPFLPNLIKEPIKAAMATIRHPLLGVYMLPFYILYNIFHSDIIILLLLSFMGATSFILIYKIGYEIVQINKFESLLLSLLFFSFAHILIMSFIPESYPFSLFLLILSLYIIGHNFNKDKTVNFKSYFILFFLTAGVTITNGIKILIAILFTPQSTKKKTNWICAILLSFLFTIVPIYIITKKISNSNTQTIRTENKSTNESTAILATSQIQDKAPGFLNFIDFSTPVLPAFIDNFIGEATIFHNSELEKDISRGRQEVIYYSNIIDAILPISLFVLFIISFIINRKEKFVQYLFCFFLVDIFIHIICRFGLNEAYIFASHWMMLMPIMFAFLLKKTFGYIHNIILIYFIISFIYIISTNLTSLLKYLI